VLEHAALGSAVIGRERMGRVACITAAIGRAYVRNPCVGVIGLDLERGNERVLGIEDEVSGLSLPLQSDRESHGARSFPASYTTPRGRAIA
jgi:hypothetical protein